MAELTGRVALVTGAARGQGREHCLALARAGADIAALDICRNQPVPRYGLATKDQLQEVVAGVEDLDRRALPLVVDVRDEGAIEQAVATLGETLGRLDILVNNAAISTSAPFWQLDEDAWDAVVDTDLKGPWLVTKHVAALLMASPAGRVVNIASTAGQRAVANFAHYVAAKHGLVGLTKAMAIELAPYGVTVNAILPGAVASPMLAGLAEEQGLTPADVHRLWVANQLLPEVLAPAEVTRALLWLVGDAARNVTGACVPVDGGGLAK
jgi:NAD(P)-dependent dehydrogenase (short-subunit alcohol dehydrogenase family)